MNTKVTKIGLTRKIWRVLGAILALGLVSSPIWLAYLFFSDPVNFVANAVGAFLWLVMVVVPGVLLVLFLVFLFGVVYGVIKALVDLFY